MGTVALTSASAETVAAGVTHMYFVGDCANNGRTVEADAKLPIRTPGTFSTLSVHLSTNSQDGTAVSVFRKNGANGTLTISFPASTTGEFADLTHSDSVAAGDLVNMNVTGGAGGSLAFFSWGVQFTASSGTVKRVVVSGGVVNVQNVTRYLVIGALPAGGSGPAAVETDVQARISAAFAIQNFAINVDTNTANFTSTLTVRINAADGTNTISVSAAATGIFEDTAHSDSVVANDLVAYKVVTAAGTGSMHLNALAIDFAGTNVTPICACGPSFGLAAGSSSYCPIGGGMAHNTVGGGTESNVQNLARRTSTLSNMKVYVQTNTANGATVLTFRKNTANGNQALSVTAATTGWFEDTTHTDAVTPTDLIDYKVDTTASSSGAANPGHVNFLETLPVARFILGTH